MSSLAKNEMYYGRDISIEEVIKNPRCKAEALVALAEEIFQSSKITLVTLGKLQRTSKAFRFLVHGETWCISGDRETLDLSARNLLHADRWLFLRLIPI